MSKAEEHKELITRATEFFEPKEGTGPHAVWYSWIHDLSVVERAKKHQARVATRLEKRAKSRLMTVINMGKGKSEEVIAGLIVHLVESERARIAQVKARHPR